MLRDFFGLFFPVYCRGCFTPLAKGEDVICLSCMAELPKTDHHLYPHNEVASKLAAVKSLHRAMAYLRFVKGGKVQKLLHNLKYENCPEIGEKLGKWYGGELREAGFQADIDVIAPTPLHRNKLRKRGYNQSACFSRGLSFALEKPCAEHALERIVKTTTQTNKTKSERWKNVEGVFRVADKEAVRGKRVLLVDDVITTGATLEACAQAVEPYSASVSAVVIAVAQ